MAKKNDDMLAKIGIRVAAEGERTSTNRQDAPPAAVRALEISDDALWAYLRENRVGDAKLYCRLHRGRVVYLRIWERWLIWQDHHWREDDYQEAYQRIEAVCALYQRFADAKRGELAELSDRDERDAVQHKLDVAERRIKLLRDRNGQDNLLTMVCRVPNPLIVLPKHLDQQHYLKACPNGVIDLRTGELHDGRPEDYLLNAMPTAYRPELLHIPQPCPETERFLLSSMDGDQEVVDFIWRLLGYGLITRRKDHIFVVFHGEHGRNGKDTLIKLITHVLGGALSGDVPVEMLLQSNVTRNSSGPSPDVLQLRGMCLAWINEAEENQRFALARLKKLTGGGFISARGLQDKAQTTWEQTHLPIMTTNELPKAKAEDAAFWQRAIIIRWELSFVPEPKEAYERPADKDLEDKVKAEAQGVLARMVRGAMEYLKEGLRIPPKVQGWTRSQRMKWDDLGQFFEEWCELEPRQENPDAYVTRIAAADLYEAYCLWYARNKDRRYSISAKKFADLLNKKDIPGKRSNGSWRLGIVLNAEGQDALEEARSRRDPSGSFRGSF